MAADLAVQVTQVLEDYLGPAANRFVNRQISSHLNKKPNDLTPADVTKLCEWVKVSMALLTDDKKTVDECAKRILALK